MVAGISEAIIEWFTYRLVLICGYSIKPGAIHFNTKIKYNAHRVSLISELELRPK